MIRLIKIIKILMRSFGYVQKQLGIDINNVVDSCDGFELVRSTPLVRQCSGLVFEQRKDTTLTILIRIRSCWRACEEGR